jgi:hypothetical protein
MKLTKRQRQILEGLRQAEDEASSDFDLVESGNEVWFGCERTNFPTLLFFLKNCLVSITEDSEHMDSNYYRINGWGCKALDDPDFDPEQTLMECIAAAERAGS